MAEKAAAHRSVSLEELIALNDEIVALVRAGVPLEEGLLALGGDLRGRLGDVAREAGQRIEQGQSLADALEVGPDGYAAVYKAVLEAGQQSGQLASALEGLAVVVRRAADLRRQMLLAWVYPLCVLVLAYGLAVWTVLNLLPMIHASYPVQAIDQPPLGARWVAWASSLPMWVWVVPPLVLAAGLLVLRWMPRRWPGPQSVVRANRLAMFVDVLGMLVEQGHPLPESLELAARASGSRELMAESQQLVERLRKGESPTKKPAAKMASAKSLPPMLLWVLGGKGVPLAEPLRQLAESYHRIAVRKARFWNAAIPLLLAVTIGGGATLAYSMLVIVPWYGFMHQLELPVVR